ncbi:MAG: CRISPR-associated protein [Proteobacteria bacterium]|nr:MAG: CRISPR-associated protein [Pseudomonadota bacterium]
MPRRPRNSADLRRKAPKREPYDRVLIVCEGEKTEPVYFQDLRNHYGLSTANIAITPADGSDPVSVVKHAKKLQKDESKQGERFDKVYCVFDRDEHTNFDAASDQLNANHILPARSWPCFEFWLSLHFEYQRSPFYPAHGKTAAQLCQSSLAAKLPAYTKGMQGIFDELLPSLDTGIQNATRAQRDAEETGEQNPSTEVHELVEYLRSLKS